MNQIGFHASLASDQDGSWLGWRYAATTRAKGYLDVTSEPNDDAWRIRRAPEHLSIAVIDVATHKRGISGAEIQAALTQAFDTASSNAMPAEMISMAHASLAAELRIRGAKGVACLLIVRLERDGHCHWANVGDAALLLYRPANLWRRGKLKLLNTRHRRGHGLTQCVGTAATGGPRVEEGGFPMACGDRLLLASDGILHDAMRLSSLRRWLDAHHRQRNLLLPADLARKIEAEARFSQPTLDDTALVAVERMAT